MLRKKKSNKPFIIFLLIFILLSSFAIMYANDQHTIKVDKGELVYVQSDIGCIATIFNETNFEIQENFREAVQGKRLVRCK